MYRGDIAHFPVTWKSTWRGVTTLTNAVSGQSQNCTGNLEISPGIGTLGIFFRGTTDNSGTLQKKSGHRRNFYFRFIYVNLSKLGMKSSTNETIQTASARPVAYSNQSEMHPTGWAHSWVPIPFNHVHCTRNHHSSHVQILFRSSFQGVESAILLASSTSSRLSCVSSLWSAG